MATTKIRGYVIVAHPATLIIPSGDRLPRARAIHANSDLGNREGRALLRAMKGLTNGVYRAVLDMTPPVTVVIGKPVKLATEINALEQRAKDAATKRTGRVLPTEADRLRRQGLRCRALADALRGYLGGGAVAFSRHDVEIGHKVIDRALGKDVRGMRLFIEWAVGRAGEEAPKTSGMTRSFLDTLAADGAKLLKNFEA